MLSHSVSAATSLRKAALRAQPNMSIYDIFCYCVVFVDNGPGEHGAQSQRNTGSSNVNVINSAHVLSFLPSAVIPKRTYYVLRSIKGGFGHSSLLLSTQCKIENLFTNRDDGKLTGDIIASSGPCAHDDWSGIKTSSCLIYRSEC